MSNSSPTVPHDRPSLREVLQPQALRLLVAPLRFVAFWAAVALPFLYVPLLLGGLNGQRAVVFAGLVALNALSLVAGHGYRQ